MFYLSSRAFYMQSTFDEPDARLSLVAIGALLWCADTDDAGVPMMADALSALTTRPGPAFSGATIRTMLECQ
jgi:hypothetical protein